MNMRIFLMGLVVGAGTALVTGHVISQDSNAGDPPMPQMDEEMMQKMMQRGMEIASPGKHHEFLEFFVGDWAIETSIVGMEGSSKGTASMKMVLGGRYLEQEYNSSMMGMPMQGAGVTGYDNYKKKFVGAWYDSMSTSVRYSEGTLDRTGKVMTQFGEMDEWMDDTHDKMVKYVTRIIDDNHFEFEVHDLTIVPGETAVIRVNYARVVE